MAKKIEKFVPSTTVLTAKIAVVRQTEDGEQGKLEGNLDLESKKVEIDLSIYRRMPIENLRMLGEGLVVLAKEARDALETL